MLKNRVIPCLLLQNRGLVKTIKFNNPTYIGDPINAVKIFNEKGVDELIFLDITATKEKRNPNYKLLSEISSECFMPLGYGGGVNSEDQISKLLKMGIEKIIINSAASNHKFVEMAVKVFGSSTIVGSVDIKRNFWGNRVAYVSSGKIKIPIEPIEYVKKLEELGVGEIIVNSIDRDGTMSGYDIGLIKRLSSEISIPLVACGGAGSLNDLREAIQAGASAVAAGSLFVFKGPNKAVLINYPTAQALEEILK